MALTPSTPAWKGNNEAGHISTFSKEDIGAMGMAGVYPAWWVLCENVTAKKWFIGSDAGRDGFDDVVSQKFDLIEVTPIQ